MSDIEIIKLLERKKFEYKYQWGKEREVKTIDNLLNDFIEEILKGIKK